MAVDWIRLGLIDWFNLNEATGATRLGQRLKYSLASTNNVPAITGLAGNGAGFTLASSQVLTSTANIAEWTSAVTAGMVCWVKKASAGHTIAVGTSGSTTRRFCIQDWSDGNLYVGCGNGAVSFASMVNPMTLNAWNCVLIGFNGLGAGNSDRLKLWVNGTPRTLSYTLSVPTSLANNLQGPFKIGQDISIYSTGHVDMTGLFRNMPTDQDAIDLYAAGVGENYVLAKRYWYYRPSAAGANTGLDWTNAFTSRTGAQYDLNHGDGLRFSSSAAAPFSGEATYTGLNNLDVTFDEGPDGETNTNGARSATFAGAGPTYTSTTPAAEPQYVAFDYQFDNVLGSHTKYTFDGWDKLYVATNGVDIEDCVMPYGFLKKNDATPTTPGAGEWGWSAGTLYVHPGDGATLADCNEKCVYAPGGENGFTFTDCNNLFARGRNVHTFLPGVAGGVGNKGYGTKVEGGANNRIDDGVGISCGLHTMGAGGTSLNGNRFRNHLAIGLSGDSSGLMNQAVMAFSDSATPFEAESDGLTLIGAPHFCNTGLPINLTWAHLPGLSHASATALSNKTRWKNVVSIDKSRRVELGHGITNTLTTAPLAISHINGTMPSVNEGELFPCHARDCIFRGPQSFNTGMFWENCLFDRDGCGKTTMRHIDGGVMRMYAKGCTFISGTTGTFAGATADFYEAITDGCILTFEDCDILLQGQSLSALFGLNVDIADNFAVRLIGCRIDSDGSNSHAIARATSGGNQWRSLWSDGNNVFGTSLNALTYNSDGSAGLATINDWRASVPGGHTDVVEPLHWGHNGPAKVKHLRRKYLGRPSFVPQF